MEEILDVYTRDGKYLGTKPKSFCHGKNPGVYHKPAWVWIINDNNEILVQRKSSRKKYPNTWDMPSAGHVLTGETTIEGAIRETYEELGVKTRESDYKFMFEYIYEPGYEIAQIYLLKLNTNNFILQESEVSEVKWMNYDDFKKLLLSDEFAPHDYEYRKLVIKMFDKILKN